NVCAVKCDISRNRCCIVVDNLASCTEFYKFVSILNTYFIACKEFIELLLVGNFHSVGSIKHCVIALAQYDYFTVTNLFKSKFATFGCLVACGCNNNLYLYKDFIADIQACKFIC